MLSAFQGDCQHEVTGLQMNTALAQYSLYAFAGIVALLVVSCFNETDKLPGKLLTVAVSVRIIWIAFVGVLAGLTVIVHRPDGVPPVLIATVLFAPMLMLWWDANSDMQGDGARREKAKQSFQNIVMISLAVSSIALSVILQGQSAIG